MASLPTESDYDFVKKPSEDFFCPVTFDLLLEPHQTLCCGKHLSQEAATKLQQDGEPCPLCTKTLNTMPDKYFQRTVNELEVRCPNKSLGCEWVGEVGSLDRHLSQTSVEGECQFVTVTCPYSCGDDLQRCQLEGHKMNDCHNRPFTCQYCGHHDTHNEVTNKHWPDCEKYPVECPNKSLGCQWGGERGGVDRHLNNSSEEGECQFVTVVCPYDCGDGFQRCQLEGHKANDCPKRPFPCQYCGYEATYNEVTSEHWPICDEYPLPCPNQCENDIKRQDLQDHLKKTCPREVIKCEFSNAGCEVECERGHMQTHLDENMIVHLTKLSHKTEQQQSQIDTLERKTEQQQSQIDVLERKTEQQQPAIWRHNSRMHSMVSTLNRVVGPTFSPTPEMEMDKFEHYKTTETRWFSNSFYSHHGGYKMCLAVDASGRGCGKGTHISIFVHLKHGQHDKHLKWPFRGNITIQLLNWKDDDIDDKGHWQKIISFDGDSADLDIGCKVSWWKGKVGTNSTGMGYNQFIAHTELNAADKNYLHNNCLRFRILEVAGTNIDVL